MTKTTRGRGRPPLADSEPEAGDPALTRLRAADLSETDLQARRYADRMRKRRYRETRRRNRDNPQALPPGVDGLELMKAQAIIAVQDAAIARRDREIAELQAKLERVRR